MDTVKIDARDVNFWYGDFHALKGISMQIEEKSVVAFIGPSGCGKSTFLRLFNRMPVAFTLRFRWSYRGLPRGYPFR